MAQVRKLTDLAIRAANRPGRLFDGGGLLLAITARRDSGLSKCWLVRYTAPDGRAREMGLGAYPEVSLAQARDAAAARRLEARNGVDPIASREEARQAARNASDNVKTFKWCAERYVAMHEANWKNDKHVYQWRATLRDYAEPFLGETPVAEVDTDLVLRALEPIWKTKRETARRLRGRIEAILNWAATRGYRDKNKINPALWRGHLQYVLPKQKSRRLVKHLPSLPYREIPEFMPALRLMPGLAPRALEYTILAAARSGETRFARWAEIDFRHGVWTVPPERMKGGLEHRVPLSPRAIEILAELKREIPPLDWNPANFIFPGLKAGKPLSDAAMNAVLDRMGKTSITVHGFRSSFRTWGAECTQHSPEVVKMALAHIIEDAVDAAYQRGELFEKRKVLMRDWAAYCASPPSSGVVEFPSACIAGGGQV